MTDENRKFVIDDDKKLIADFKAGDKKSFNKIVLKYQKMVYNITRKMVINHDDADEITQNVFIKLYKSINQFKGESKLSTYLYRISINMSLNYLKKRNFIQNKLNTSIDEKEIFDRTDALKKIETNEKEIFIRRAIENLPPQQRTVFILRFYENLSYEEISEILGTTIGGLKANFYHATRNLKSFFENNNYKNLF